MEILNRTEEYDVCIVGSGAGGGMAAKVLTDAGAKVVMLEAGPEYYSETNGHMFKWNYESMRRGVKGDKPFGEFDACIGGWEMPGEPYTRAAGTQWDWFRARNLGGRTHHWGRISLRFGPDDFRARSIDGEGDDWPIGYDDLAPYYDKVDQFVGIFGNEDGIYNEPAGKHLLPPPRPRAHELLVKKAGKEMGMPVVSSRLSILTKPLNGRPACHYCGQCGRGCATNSNFSSPSVLIRPALQSGNLTLITHAMAREVVTNDEGLATGVSYVNTQDMMEYQVRAKVVVLAASACSTARIMLNSKSTRHPNGLSNSSDVLGRYLMDSTGSGVTGIFPQMMDMPAHNNDGTGGGHVYIPWWLKRKDVDFLRGYHIEMGGGRHMPGYGFMWRIDRYNDKFVNEERKGSGGYGKQLKDDYRRYFGSYMGFSGRGEMIARRSNYCEIDPDVVDKYGIPVLRFNVKWSEQEYMQAKHMQETIRGLIDHMGGYALGDMPTREQGYGIEAPGRIIHEVGTTRMGDNPGTSVLNSNCQAHEAKNVFVADAGPFVSQAHKNTTWSILALAWRTSDYIVDQRKKGNI